MFSRIDLEQRTPEWLAFRRNHVMASEAPVIYKVSKYQKTREDLIQEKLGKEKKIRMTASMQKGVEKEAEILEIFSSSLSQELNQSIVFKPCVVCKNHHAFPLAASLDGLSEDGKHAVEIKVTNFYNHEMVDTYNLPPFEFYPQLQHQLAVIGLDFLWYISYFPPEASLRILKVHRDSVFIDKLMDKELAFWEEVLKHKNSHKEEA